MGQRWRFHALWAALALLLAAPAHADLRVVDLDPASGTPRVLERLDAALTGPSPAPALEIASAFVNARWPGLPLDAPAVSSLPGGIASVRWRQSVDGVPVVDRELRVNVAADGRVLNVLGAPATALDVNTSPALDAGDAVRAVQAATGVYRVVGRLSTSAASLVVFADRLAWRVRYRTAPDAVLDVMVDASSGELLREDNMVKAVAPASVWERYPGTGLGGAAATVDLEELKYLPAGAADLTGPNAHAYSDLDDNDVSTANEEVTPVGGSFAFPLVVGSGSGCDGAHRCSWNGSAFAANRAQGTVQAFYLANRFHDHLAAAPIGFGPEQGAFEGIDKLELNTFDGAATGPDSDHLNNANMLTPPDGQTPLMQMYLFRNPSYRNVHSGDDAAVLYHEYTHGLSNRLVTDASGAGALNSAQSGAMGEAWSDWYALDFLVAQFPSIDSATAGDVSMGEYSEYPGGSGRLRTEGLDCPVGGDPVRCPGRAGAGTGGYTYGDFGRIFGTPEVHADGEIWAQTLWDLRTALGVTRTESVVTAGMALLPPEPSFLDARNGILLADVALHAGADLDAIWAVFARRGMGFFAASAGGGDTAPSESVALPPAPDGPRGSISGQVTDLLSGAGVSGLTVGIAGLSYSAVTAADGRYTIADVPAGTYVKVVAGGSGYDYATSSLGVPAGGTIMFSPAVRRNWSSTAGGATVTDTNGGEFSADGCGPVAALDQAQGTGWSTGAGGDKFMITQLPAAVEITQFALDPSEVCGDAASSSTGAYRIETSPDGAAWTVATTGTFNYGNRHQMNFVTPAAGASGVRFVRLTLLTSLGGPFKDMAEFAVYGTPGATPDTTPPETTFTGPFSFTSEAGATFECQLDAEPFAACVSPFDPGVLEDGSHTFSVRATDAAGNVDPTPASRTFTIDTTPPETTLTGAFSFTSEPGATFECALDDAPYEGCASPFEPGVLEDGEHTFSVRATDAAGNLEPTPATRTFTIDRTPPETTLTGPFSFASEPGATFECTLDAAPYPGCTSPFAPGPLADGTHTFSVFAVDSAGNADPTPATRTFTLDTTAPESTIDPVPATVHSGPITFKVHSEPGATIECALDDGAYGPCATISADDLALGEHVYRARATDTFANVERTPAEARFSVVNAAPIPSLTVDQGAITVAGADADSDPLTFTLDFGDGGAPATGSLPAGPFEHAYAAPGEYLVRLTVRDARDATTTTQTAQIPLVVPAAPLTLSLQLTADSANLGTFVPAQAREYATSVGATISASLPAKLTVADRTGISPGHLLNERDDALPQPLQIRAATADAFRPLDNVPLTLLALTDPALDRLVTVEFKQPIGETDALRAGPYTKTLTFTLSVSGP